jgi:hypothetical protein
MRATDWYQKIGYEEESRSIEFICAYDIMYRMASRHRYLLRRIRYKLSFFGVRILSRVPKTAQNRLLISPTRHGIEYLHIFSTVWRVVRRTGYYVSSFRILLLLLTSNTSTSLLL